MASILPVKKMSENNNDTVMEQPVLTGNQLIDQLEFLMLNDPNFEVVDCPVTHRFTPGLYTREIFMPAGMRITSMIHKTEHQFMVLEGKVSVFSENDGEQLITAPFVGRTLPGTRRVLLVHEDTRWLTCHPIDIMPVDDTEQSVEDAVSLIQANIIEPYVNEIVGGRIKNNVISKKELSNNV